MKHAETHDDRVTTEAGASADQHITGAAETDEFTTDAPPTSATPANGSSNAGINRRAANAQPASTQSEDD